MVDGSLLRNTQNNIMGILFLILKVILVIKENSKLHQPSKKTTTATTSFEDNEISVDVNKKLGISNGIYLTIVLKKLDKSRRY